MINFKIFLKKNKIEFDSEKKALRWIGSLNPKGLVQNDILRSSEMVYY